MPESVRPFVFQVILHGTVQALENINVFYYATADALTTPHDIADDFNAVVLSQLPSICNTFVHWDLITCNQVKGGSAFTTYPVNVNGLVSGDGLPPFCSWDFTLQRGGVGERNGYKRFAGISENHQINGVAIPAILPSLDTVAAALASNLVVGTDPANPVIRRTQEHHVAFPTPKYYTMSGASYAKIGTQNSRKFGHGR